MRKGLGVAYLLLLWGCTNASELPEIVGESDRSGLVSATTLSVPRESHTMTLLTNGKVLIAGGSAIDAGPYQTTEVYDILTHTIAPGAPMVTPRESATSVPLRNGRALVAGGSRGSGNILSSAELYDPATNTWSNTGSMGSPRVLAPAVVLPDGRVLMAGGRSTGGAVTNTAVLYNPVTNTWAAAAPMTNPHSDFPMVLINGKALAIGGTDSPLSIEEYDPATNVWTSRASPPYGILNSSTATVLLDGRVLVRATGGEPLLFNPSSNTWANTNPASLRRGNHTATLLSDGRVAVFAGTSGSTDTAVVEVYDPVTNNWTLQSPLGSAKYDHTSLLLPTGQVLVVGGSVTVASVNSTHRTLELLDFSRPFWVAYQPNSFPADSSSSTLTGNSSILISGGTSASTRSAVFDPSNNMSTATQNSADAHARHSAVTLSDGRVLVAGSASSEVFNPMTNVYSSRTPLLSTRSRARAITLEDQSVLLVGGDDGTCVSSAETYDVDTQVWRALNSPGAVCEPTLTLLQSSQALLSGEGLFMVFSRQTGAWTSVTTDATLLRGHSAALLSDGRVFISGGRNGTSATALTRTSFYRPSTNQIVTGPSLALGRYNHITQPLWSGRVLIVGDRTGGAGVRSAALFEPLDDSYVALSNAPADAADATASLSPDGRVIIFSGTSITGFDEGRAPLAMYRPTLSTLSNVEAGATLSLAGTGFTGVSEGATGSSISSPSNVPVLMLMRQGNSALYFARTASWTSTTAQVVIPSTLPAGMYVARLSVSAALSDGRVLRVTSPIAAACGANAACSSGFCSDGVCCNTACAGACDACSVAAGASSDGTCSPSVSTTVCRASTGMCDVAETCDGVSVDCPVDLPPLPSCQSMDGGTDGGTDGGIPDAGALSRKIPRYHIACGCSGAWTNLPLPFSLLIYLIRTSRRRLNRNH